MENAVTWLKESQAAIIWPASAITNFATAVEMNGLLSIDASKEQFPIEIYHDKYNADKNLDLYL